MKYLELLEKLQKENENYVILMQNGIFFVGVGKDAWLLNQKIGLKLTCMKKGVCKVGFQVKSLEKYIDKLQKENIAFLVYTYNKVSEKEELIYKNDGEYEVPENIIECSNCNNNKNVEEEVLERVKRLGKNK